MSVVNSHIRFILIVFIIYLYLIDLIRAQCACETSDDCGSYSCDGCHCREDEGGDWNQTNMNKSDPNVDKSMTISMFHKRSCLKEVSFVEIVGGYIF